MISSVVLDMLATMSCCVRRVYIQRALKGSDNHQTPPLLCGRRWCVDDTKSSRYAPGGVADERLSCRFAGGKSGRIGVDDDPCFCGATIHGQHTMLGGQKLTSSKKPRLAMLPRTPLSSRRKAGLREEIGLFSYMIALNHGTCAQTGTHFDFQKSLEV